MDERPGRMDRGGPPGVGQPGGGTNVFLRPQFWWRVVIVLAGVLGLLTGDHPLAFFTTQSNLIVLGYFVCVLYWMVRRRTTDAAAPHLRGGITLWILITGLVAHFVLNHGVNPLPGLVHGAPATRLANLSIFLEHYVVPVMVLVDWLAFGPHRVVRWGDLPWWLLFPFGYGIVLVFRAVLFPTAPYRYPYFFLDPVGHGYGWVVLQLLKYLVEFAVLGALVIGLDRLASWRRPGALS